MIQAAPAAAEHALRTWRQDRAIKLTDLAETVGVSQPYLSQIEKGLRTPSLDVAARLAAATGLKIDVFVRRQETKTNG